MMIQCDKCNVWQHGACVGIWGDDEAPDGELEWRGGADVQSTSVRSASPSCTAR
jgi:hypothetical protein